MSASLNLRALKAETTYGELSYLTADRAYPALSRVSLLYYTALIPSTETSCMVWLTRRVLLIEPLGSIPDANEGVLSWAIDTFR